MTRDESERYIASGSSPRQRQILEYLRTHEESTTRELVAALNWTYQPTDITLRGLMRGGFIMRERRHRIGGSGTMGRKAINVWTITEKGVNLLSGVSTEEVPLETPLGVEEVEEVPNGVPIPLFFSSSAPPDERPETVWLPPTRGALKEKDSFDFQKSTQSWCLLLFRYVVESGPQGLRIDELDSLIPDMIEAKIMRNFPGYGRTARFFVNILRDANWLTPRQDDIHYFVPVLPQSLRKDLWDIVLAQRVSQLRARKEGTSLEKVEEFLEEDEA